tara:strand:+ start:10442 stop:11410 length:969 start_codon:yes stop_codon:yes gene_type:complete
MKYEVSQIAGDASFRKFYRIKSKKNSKILVYTDKEKFKNLAAYTAVNKFLRNNKILTPKLFDHDYKKGLIVIEDFGDLSFYKILLSKKNKFPTYKKLVNLLLNIQKIKTKKKIKTFIKKPHLISKYSINHLNKESDLFFQWYLPLVMNKKKALILKKKIKKILSKIYKKISLKNSFFVHRDFHSQNLIQVGNKIGVIDTQDALIGNPAYDLVSLIDDVRIMTSIKLKEKIFRYYLKNVDKIYKVSKINFLEDFKILSVQRSLKIIGIFSRLFKRDNKKKYLRLIPYTWKLLETRMDSKVFLDLKLELDKNISKKKRKKILYK